MQDEGRSKYVEGGEFASFFSKRETLKTATKQSDEKAEVSIDARLTSSVDAKGLVQLNVRIPIALKNMVVAERNKRKNRKEVNSDVNDIVSEALREYLHK